MKYMYDIKSIFVHMQLHLVLSFYSHYHVANISIFKIQKAIDR